MAGVAIFKLRKRETYTNGKRPGWRRNQRVEMMQTGKDVKSR